MEESVNKMLGIKVKLNEDGSINLPKDMLDFAGIVNNVEVFADAEGIYLRTADTFCSFCGINGNLEKVGEKHICKNCINTISRELERRK